MQFIQELTTIHKAVIGATVALIMVLLLVSARRRRAAADVPAAPLEPAATKTRKRDRTKPPALAGRKRRKLAAEAAHAMGVDPAPIAVPQVPEVPTVSIPEVAVVSAPVIEAPIEDVFEDVPAAESVAAEPVADAVINDPYLHEAPVNAEGVVVGQPGWPAPGELASSFDPDAFDPLPEAYGPLTDDTYDEFAVPAANSDDTTAIEMPVFSTAGEVAALEEIEEWTDTFDADDSWNETDDEVAPESTWTISNGEPQPEVAAVADPPAIDMENIWSEPDEEPLWNAAEVADVPAVAILDEGLAFDAPEPAWEGDAQDSWEHDVFETPADAFAAPSVLEIPAAVHEVPAYDPSVPAAWSGSIGGPNSPVVLDLAGLAASGHSLELVIEPSADGHGVRLRFGAPGANPVELPVVPDDAPETALFVPMDPATEGMDDTFEAELVDVSEPIETVEPEFDLSFLAGVAPGNEPPVSAEQPQMTMTPAPVVEPEYVFATPAADVEDANPVALDPAPSDDDCAMQTAPAATPTATAVMDADDDPARILADIRARLAALDARR